MRVCVRKNSRESHYLIEKSSRSKETFKEKSKFKSKMDTTDAPQIIEHINKQINFTPYDNKWIPFSKRFVSMGIHPNAKGALQAVACVFCFLQIICANRSTN
jgi:hypothetical protein